MQLLRFFAVVFFVLATLAGYGVWIHSDVKTVLGVIALGLAFFAASFITIPAPPSR